MKKQILIFTTFIIIATGILCIFSGDFGGRILKQLGSVVGMYASIEPNEHNTLARHLAERQDELDKREAVVERREQLLEEYDAAENKTAVVYITALGSLLLALILLNFYLDWRKNR